MGADCGRCGARLYGRRNANFVYAVNLQQPNRGIALGFLLRTALLF